MEHKQFGYNLGDTKTRLDRLEEGLQVISALLRNDQPVHFEGRFFNLQNARLLPRPQHPTRILVGGNGRKRTLPLVARYADLWNCQVETPETFRELNGLLDELILAEGRQPGDVKRTVMNPIMLFRNPSELDRIVRIIRSIPIYSWVDAQQMLDFSNSMKGIHGSPEQVIEKMQLYADAGADEFIIQWFYSKDIEGTEELASEILPHFAFAGLQ